jgi:hypothetical protein
MDICGECIGYIETFFTNIHLLFKEHFRVIMHNMDLMVKIRN